MPASREGVKEVFIRILENLQLIRSASEVRESTSLIGLMEFTKVVAFVDEIFKRTSTHPIDLAMMDFVLRWGAGDIRTVGQLLDTIVSLSIGNIRTVEELKDAMNSLASGNYRSAEEMKDATFWLTLKFHS